jgi:hypothetical protein
LPYYQLPKLTVFRITLIGKIVAFVLLSNIQVSVKSNTIATVTVVLLAIIASTALLQLHVIPFILSIPVFLIPVSVYTTIIGLNSKKESRMTQDHSYYFTWAAIMLTIGAEWILLYEKFGITIGVIDGLAIALGYVYLNRFKSLRA